jgi:hypothetical protein
MKLRLLGKRHGGVKIAPKFSTKKVVKSLLVTITESIASASGKYR